MNYFHSPEFHKFALNIIMSLTCWLWLLLILLVLNEALLVETDAKDRDMSYRGILWSSKGQEQVIPWSNLIIKMAGTDHTIEYFDHRKDRNRSYRWVLWSSKGQEQVISLSTLIIKRTGTGQKWSAFITKRTGTGNAVKNFDHQKDRDRSYRGVLASPKGQGQIIPWSACITKRTGTDHTVECLHH